MASNVIRMHKTFQTFALLPKSLEGDRSKIYTADVNAVVGSRKRKRSEIAVAVDNEGVNLYDVSPDLSSSGTSILKYPADPVFQSDHHILRFSPNIFHLLAIFDTLERFPSHSFPTLDILLCSRSETGYSVFHSDGREDFQSSWADIGRVTRHFRLD